MPCDHHLRSVVFETMRIYMRTSVPRLSSLIWLATPLPPNTATDDSITARPSRFTSCRSMPTVDTLVEHVMFEG
jgi:hypothetical protein